MFFFIKKDLGRIQITCHLLSPKVSYGSRDTINIPILPKLRAMATPLNSALCTLHRTTKFSLPSCDVVLNCFETAAMPEF